MPQEQVELIKECRERAIALLHSNLTEYGLMAARVKPTDAARHYYCIFGRDAAIAALGMVVCGDHELAVGACRGLVTLAKHQADNGQIPKYVNPFKEEGDFWYVGCIDATLWWLIAVHFVSQHGPINLTTELAPHIDKALQWLHCQEHPKLYLLQQNEASDWADIMPRSGYVLYTNALWYRVKQLYHLPYSKETFYHFNHLFHPYSRDLPEYRRLRLLMHYARQKNPCPDLYLSFVNFSFIGNEGDVLGNLLAILFGLTSHTRANHMLRSLKKAHIDQPIPVRVTLRPISQNDILWRPYMGRHRQNLEYCYHNSGAWPFVGGFWIAALAMLNHMHEANAALTALAEANAIDNWQFNEWFHGKTGQSQGMPGQSWNASMFLLAEHIVTHHRAMRILSLRRQFDVRESVPKTNVSG